MQSASQQIDSTTSHNSARIAPAHVLLAASMLEVLGMFHHPSVRSPDVSQALQEIARFSTLSAVIHAGSILLMLLIAYGLWDFAVKMGTNQPLVRAGAIAYGCGVLVMIGAGLVSGFIITSLASQLPRATPTDLQISFQMLILCRVLNQACANFATVAISVGIVCWSLKLCDGIGMQRWIGILGCLTGVLPVAALLFGWIHLDVHGMTTVVAVQAAWNIGVAILMLRGDSRRNL